MISERSYKEAYVWVWLPGALAPVVAGRLARADGTLVFNYGRSYLARYDAISLYAPELPLRAGALPLTAGLAMPGCIRDAAPDAWGRRVILNHRFGAPGRGYDTAELDELTYLLDSGSDRIGALDFQTSASCYIPREAKSATLGELLTSASRVEQGLPLTPALDQALFHGSSVGGARPKALIDAGDKKFIAKFSSQGDIFNVVKAEFVAMRLAREAGLDVASVQLASAAGKDVLLIERFDREPVVQGWSRRAMVSALTLFGLDEMMARYTSYEQLATIIRHRFENPKATLRELFGRLVFNVLSGNTDDHARNHSAFWDGNTLVLTPAYDICPQTRSGNEASQAMLIQGEDRQSRLSACLAVAPQFLLAQVDAQTIMAQQIKAILEHWPAVCVAAALKPVECSQLWRRQFLNPFAFEGAPPALCQLLS